ncbi:hypothetical protein ACWGH5_19905 [Streptomyces sp. NPDC054864]
MGLWGSCTDGVLLSGAPVRDHGRGLPAPKEEIFRVLAVRVRDAFLAAQDVPGVDQDDAREVCRASTAAFIAAYAQHLPLLRLLEQQAQTDDDVRALWEETQERPVHRSARYIRRLAAEGRARPVAEPLAVARAVGGMSIQFARLTVSAPEASAPQTYDAAVRDVTAMFLHLLGVDSAPR